MGSIEIGRVCKQGRALGWRLPDTTRRRVLDACALADSIRIFEDGALIAWHAPLEGRGKKRFDPTHRKIPALPRRRPGEVSENGLVLVTILEDRFKKLVASDALDDKASPVSALAQ